MLIGKRMVTLFVLTLVSTATPAIYQKGIEPRVEGAQCNIQIVDLTYVEDSRYTRTDVLTLKAYLRIENSAPNEVILSRLNLDMYYHSQIRGRYELIGYFNTTQEYVVPAATVNEYGDTVPGWVQTTADGIHSTSVKGKAGEKYTEHDTFAYITFVRLSTYYGEDAPVYEALADLIQYGSLSVKLKGDARIGPFTFTYQSDQLLRLDLWDSEFVIEDIFPAIKDSDKNYDPSADPDYEFNTLFFHLKTRNPSRVPVILFNYTFHLKERGSGATIATGVYSRELSQFYDPDLTFEDSAGATVRKTISQAFEFDNTDFIRLPGDQGTAWHDIVLGFNFTGFDSAGNPNAYLTSRNLYWLVSKLITENHIEATLEGHCAVILGTFDNQIHIGLNTTIGFQKVFRIDEVNLWQRSIDDPKPMIKGIKMGPVTAHRMDINSETNMIGINYSTSLNFTNPYRFDIGLLDSNTSIYRVDAANPADPNGKYEFISGTPDPLLSGANKVLRAAERVTTDEQATDLTLDNTEIVPTTTTIPMEMYNEYSTDTFTNTSGLAWILKDFKINPQIMNLSDPMFLMDPAGIRDTDQYLRVDVSNPVNAYVDPMKVVRYLIQQDVDPLQLLQEVNTTREVFAGQEAFMPLKCSFFGTNESYYQSTLYRLGLESEELPDSNRNYTIPDGMTLESGHSGYFAAPRWYVKTWDDYYHYTGNFPLPRELNQYDVAQFGPFKGYLQDLTGVGGLDDEHWYLTGNYDPVARSGTEVFKYYRGGIFASDRLDWDGTTAAFASGTGRRSSDLIWRVHGNAPWGYRFDYENYKRGYYVGIYPKNNEWAAFCQNFKFPAWLTDSSVQVTSVKIGVSYKFPTNYSTDAYAIVGLGHYSSPSVGYKTPFMYAQDASADYLADILWTSGQKAHLIDGRYGWMLRVNETQVSQDWMHVTLDVTDEVMHRLNNYTATGNADFLESELMFGAVGWQTDNQPVYFDDVVIQVEYARETTGKVSLIDLWEYLDSNDARYESTDPNYDAGNMYHFLRDAKFDPIKFMEFVNDDFGGGVEPDSGREVNFLDFMNYDGSDPTTLTELLQNKFTELSGSEPVNFLEMLNYSEYIIPKPTELSSIEREPWTVYADMVDAGPGIGPRRMKDEYWVLKDPYVASRELVKALSRNIFVTPDGAQFSPLEYAGEELWFMLDNLDAYLPWVNLYLATHGWSNDDIWDLWEALGLGAEIKKDSIVQYNYQPAIELTEGPHGLMQFGGVADVTVTTDIDIRIDLGFIGSWDISVPTLQTGGTSDFDFQFRMGQTMREGAAQLYSYLLDHANQVYVPGVGDNPDVIINSASPLIEMFDTLPTPATSDAYFAPPTSEQQIAFVTVWTTNRIWLDMSATDYAMHVWINHGSISDPFTGTRNNPYFDTQGGFNEVGAKKLFSLLRNDIKFGGSTFVRTGGDPVSFFRFLDDYYYDGELDDYSSYELLEFNDVKALDFVDIITGYNWINDTFDQNMNGKADDWVAPYDRTTYSPEEDYRNFWYDVGGIQPELEGWGTKIWDTRLFYTSNPSWTSYNGQIIWSDSRDFTYVANNERGLAHLGGDIYLGGSYPSDRFWEGAPPVVNLIDMLAWLSRTTGYPDPDLLLRWLASSPDVTQGGTERYQIRTRNQLTDWTAFNKMGIERDGVWSLLNNMTFNTTGLMNWVVNVKNLDGFDFLYKMYEEDGFDALNPLDLIYFVTHPDIVRYNGGTIGFLHRESFGKVSDPAKVIIKDYSNLDLRSALAADLLWATDHDSLAFGVTRPGVLVGQPIATGATDVQPAINQWLANLQAVDGLTTAFSIETVGDIEFNVELTDIALVKDISKWKLGIFFQMTGGAYTASDLIAMEIYDLNTHSWDVWHATDEAGNTNPEIVPANGPVFWFYADDIGGNGAYDTNNFHSDYVSGTREIRVRLRFNNEGPATDSFLLDSLNCTGRITGQLDLAFKPLDDGKGIYDWIVDLDGFASQFYHDVGDSLTLSVQDVDTGAWIPWYNVTETNGYRLFQKADQPLGFDASPYPGDLLNIVDLAGYRYNSTNLAAPNDGLYAELVHATSPLDTYAYFEVNLPYQTDFESIQSLDDWALKIRMDVNSTDSLLDGGICQLQARTTGGSWLTVDQLVTDAPLEWKNYTIPLSRVPNLATNLANFLWDSGESYQLQFRFRFEQPDPNAFALHTRIDYVDLVPGSYDAPTAMRHIGNTEASGFSAQEKVNRFFDRINNEIRVRLTFESDFSNFDDVNLDAVKLDVVKSSDAEMWKLFNGSWWKEEKGDPSWWNDPVGDPTDTMAYAFFERYHELEVLAGDPNLAYNYFRILQGLYVDQVSWFNLIISRVESPLDFLASTEIIDYESLIQQAALLGAESTVEVAGNVQLHLYGVPVSLSSGEVTRLQYIPEIQTISAAYHMLGTYDPDVLKGDNFAYY
ncbi:MAG: hypothetical protein Kow0069_21690 [Promethearchaeota archaeon]